MLYSPEVEHMTCVAKGPNHGPAPIPQEGKWVQAKEVRDISGLSVSMSGGVAHNRGVVRALAAVLGREVAVPARPDTVGALGAALIARERRACA